MPKYTKTEALNNIFAHMPKTACIADFGCGQGVLLKNLAQKNPSYKLYGFDIINDVETEDFIYNSINLDGSFVGVENESFDAVFSQHVMEHLKNPLVYFSEMVRSLKVGGYLFIETPSDRSTLLSYPFSQELNLILSYYDDPTHVGRPWSPQSLYRLGCYHNLDVICSEYDSDVVSKALLPFNFVKFLMTKNTDKFVDDYWKALGWCGYAVFKKNAQSSHNMNYFSFKDLPHGKLGNF